MTWTCAAIDHGVTIFPHGKIGPCALIRADYLKPITELSNPNRFTDLKTKNPPAACRACVSDEYRHMPSYRAMFNSLKTVSPGLQFVDIRNTNLCNLKCRYCGPHFSSQWARELKRHIPIINTTIVQKQIITDSLHWLYFTGGEPLINGDHWDLLAELILSKQAQNIALVYNSNLTTLTYKDRKIFDIWSHFKKVDVKCSIDAVGATFEYIRSGADWRKVSDKIDTLLTLPVKITLTPVISILNIWHIGELCDYAERKKIKIEPTVLVGPDYLALDVIPDQLQAQALAAVAPLKKHIQPSIYNHIVELINNNQNQCLFPHTISHTLLLDHMRGEKLFDLLPFSAIAQEQVLENHEYESK